MTDKNLKISDESTAAPIKLWQTLILCAVCSLAAALSAAAGSVFFMCVGGVSFAFLLLHSRASLYGRAVWGCLPLSYALALLFSNDPLFSLAALLFVPVGAALYFCVKRRASLSVTTAVLCLFITLCTCAMFGAVLYSEYGSITEGARQYLGALKNVLDSFIAALASVTDDNGIAFLSDETLAQIKEEIIMQTPAFIIVGLELLAYGAAKLFLLFCIMFSQRKLLPSPWRVKVALPTSLLFVLSYIVYTFSTSSGVIYYSAASLMFILMPLSSISGFHAMFGKDSRFRAARTQQTRVLLIVMCVVFLILGSPYTLLSVFSFWGAFDSLSAALKERARKRDGDDL